MSERAEEHLWDPGAAPDPDVRRLEELLAPYRYRATESGASSASAPRLALALSVPVALAAALLVAWQIGLLRRAVPQPGGYAVQGLAGVERVGPGDQVVTDTDAARLEIGALGDVEVRPGSRLRVLDAGGGGHVLWLERGAIRASILARPRVFQVGTPAGLAIDLGCEYDLTVGDGGAAHLAVRSGRVSFETGGQAVIVPAGASCSSIPGRGPTIPVFDELGEAFRDAAERLWREPTPDPADLERVLAADVRTASLTLWHLLAAPSRATREAVYERLAVTYPRLPGADRESLLAGEEIARLAWRASIERDWR